MVGVCRRRGNLHTDICTGRRPYEHEDGPLPAKDRAWNSACSYSPDKEPALLTSWTWTFGLRNWEMTVSYQASMLAQLVKKIRCNAGDLGSIPGLGRSTGEGIGYPLQYFQASLVAQTVKHLPAMWETWIRSLGQEDLLEKGMAAHPIILAWRITWIV